MLYKLSLENSILKGTCKWHMSGAPERRQKLEDMPQLSRNVLEIATGKLIFKRWM